MNLIVFAAIGRLLVWTIQTSGPTQRIKKWLNKEFIDELFECDFCLGFWVFTALAFLFEINILEPLYFPVFSEIITGQVASFVVHLARVGWTTKWGYEVLE
jgi:hypothetical protein